MSEGGGGAEDTPRTPPPEVSEAVVEVRSRISLVWLIPVVAALIGGWLAFKAFSERGPLVTIAFQSAEGLEAGKTKVRYKAVEVGEVEAIRLVKDLSSVLVEVRLVKGASVYLTENTRFWVVRARVSAGQVTGLGTLFSGAYIGIDPSTQGKAQRHFQGLEVPPVIVSGEPGRLFTLRARDLGSIEVGSPIYYRWIKVGQVAAYELDETGDQVTVKVFVSAPHDERIRSNTRFWNASGVDVAMSAEGLSIDTVSLAAVLIGGIAFGTPDGLAGGEPVAEDHVFDLYPNRRAVDQPILTVARRFLLYFDQSVGGLVPGSPVEFRGIKIGEVRDVKLVFDAEARDLRIPVLIEVQPERLTVVGKELGSPRDNWNVLVERGMRAQLKTGNLITGQLAVSFDLHPDAPVAQVDWSGPVPVLPTTPSAIEELKTGLTQFAQRLQGVPVDEIGVGLNQLVAELRTLSRRLNSEVAPSLVATLGNAERTLGSADELIASDSAAGQELRRLLLELAEAAQALRLLTEHLEQHPEDLIRGKERGR